MNSWNKYGVAGLALNDYHVAFEAPAEVRNEVRDRLENDVVEILACRSAFELETRIHEASAHRQLEMIQWMIG